MIARYVLIVGELDDVRRGWSDKVSSQKEAETASGSVAAGDGRISWGNANRLTALGPSRLARAKD